MERVITGFVCLARRSNRPLPRIKIYGENKGRGTGSFEAFTTNNLAPFSSRDLAEGARNELEALKDSLGFNRSEIAHLRMKLRPFRAVDLTGLSGERLIVIAQSVDDGTCQLFGRWREGALQVGQIPGSLLETNCLRCFTRLSHALVCAAGVKREGQYRAFLSTFSLRELGRKLW